MLAVICSVRTLWSLHENCTGMTGELTCGCCHAGLRGDVRSEWDETKQHDVLFLLTVQPPDQVALGALRDRGEEPTPAQQHGLIYVRGAEVIEVRPLESVELACVLGSAHPSGPCLGQHGLLTCVLEFANLQFYVFHVSIAPDLQHGHTQSRLAVVGAE